MSATSIGSPPTGLGGFSHIPPVERVARSTVKETEPYVRRFAFLFHRHTHT